MPQSPLPSQPTPFDEMQKAVDIVNSSHHPTNKIAAALSGREESGGHYSVAMTNYWPERIHACLGADVRIGDSSGTIHAETACILTAPGTNGASLYITDPFCPNCAKNMAEAGIKSIYIDHKGFAKDFASRRREAFDDMSMRICEKAGINVFEVNRKERKLTPILAVPDGFQPVEDRPVRVDPADPALEPQSLNVAIWNLMEGSRRFAAGIARDGAGKSFVLTAFAHPAIGFSYARDAAELEQASGKYSFMLEPVNRLLMNAARRGLKLRDGMIYVSQVPTSREQVNLIGAGLHRVMIGDRTKARDEDSLNALAMLEQHKLLSAAALSFHERR